MSYDHEWDERKRRYAAMKQGLTVDSVSASDTLVVYHEHAPYRLECAHISRYGWVDLWIAEVGRSEDLDVMRHVALPPHQMLELVVAYCRADPGFIHKLDEQMMRGGDRVRAEAPVQC